MAVQESTLRVAIDARKARKGASDFKKASKDVEKGAIGASNSLKTFNRIGTRSDKTTNVLANSLKRLFIGFSAFIALKSSLGILTDFETGMVGVAKTTDLAVKELAQLSDEIIRLSTEIPVTTNQLLEIAQAAGQLGVKGADNILLFTKTIAKLGVASNLAGDQAATVLARLLNITGEAVSTIDTLASVIVALGNNFATTEAEIAQFGIRIATTTALFNVSSAEALAFGTALSALGQNAEAGGTVIGRAFIQIDKAIRAGGKSLDDLAKLTGKTADEITKLFRRDSVKGFQLFIEGLEKVIKSGGDASAELEKFGLRGLRAVPILSTLAKNSNILADALKIAGKETENATALNIESEKAFDTLASATTIFVNTIKGVILEFKNSNGVLKSFVVISTDVIKVLFGVGEASGKSKVLVTLLATAVGGVSIAFGVLLALKVPFFVATIGTAFSSLASIISGFILTQGVATASTVALTGSLVGATVASKTFTLSLLNNPFGIVAVALSILIALFVKFSGVLDSGTSQINDNIDALKREADAFKEVHKSLETLNAERKRALELGDITGQINVIEKTISRLTKQSIELRKIPENFKGLPLSGLAVDFKTFTKIKTLLGENEEAVRELVLATAIQFGGIERLVGQNLTDADRVRTGLTKFIDANADLETIITQAKPEFTIALIERAIATLNKDITKLTKSAESNTQEQEKSLKGLELLFDSVSGKIKGVIGLSKDLQAQAGLEIGIDALRKENELLRLNQGEREIALTLIRFENKARETGTALTEQQILNIRGLIMERQRDREAIEQQAEATRKLEEAFGGIRDRLKEIKESSVNLFANIGKDIAGFAIPSFLGGEKEPMDFGAIAGDPEKNPFGFTESNLEQLQRVGIAFDSIRASIIKYTGSLNDAEDANLSFTKIGVEATNAAVTALTGAFIDQAIAGDISAKSLAKSVLESTSQILKALAQLFVVKALEAFAEKDFVKAATFSKAALLAGFGAIAFGVAARAINIPTREESAERLGFGGGGPFQAGRIGFTGGPVTRTESVQRIEISFQGEPGGLADNTQFTDKLIETIAKRIGDGKIIVRRA